MFVCVAVTVAVSFCEVVLAIPSPSSHLWGSALRRRDS
jgi:hypothetical protein